MCPLYVQKGGCERTVGRDEVITNGHAGIKEETYHESALTYLVEIQSKVKIYQSIVSDYMSDVS